MLVCLGGSNRISYSGWLICNNLFQTVLDTGKSTTKVLDLMSGGDPLSGSQMADMLCVLL